MIWPQKCEIIDLSNQISEGSFEMSAKENTLAILKGFEGFTREVGVLDHNEVKGVVLADELGNEIFVSVTTINPVDVPSGSGKSFNRGTTGGFVYTTDGLGVSQNLIETVRKPRTKLVA